MLNGTNTNSAVNHVLYCLVSELYQVILSSRVWLTLPFQYIEKAAIAKSIKCPTFHTLFFWLIKYIIRIFEVYFFFLDFSIWIYLKYTVYTTKWLLLVHKCTNLRPWRYFKRLLSPTPSTCTLKDVFILDRVSGELTLRLLVAGHSLSASRGKSLSNSPSSCREAW